MKYLMMGIGQPTLVVAVVCSLGLSSAFAQPGPAPVGTAIAQYTAATGEIIVSVTNVSNWYVQSESSSMTGPDDVGAVLPLAPSSDFVSNNALRVGELDFGGDFSYTDINLGNVAATGLSDSDLTVWWNAAGLETPLESQPIICIGCISDATGDFDMDGDVDGDDFKLWQQGGSPSALSASDLALWERDYSMTSAAPNIAAVPEPASLALIGLGLCAAIGSRRRD